MPIQITHLVTLALVSSAWGLPLDHPNQHQELHARNVAFSDTFLPRILQRREDPKPTESSSGAPNQLPNPAGTSDKLDANDKKAAAKSTDKPDGSDESTGKEFPSKEEATEPAGETKEKKGLHQSPSSSLLPADLDKLKARLDGKRMKFDVVLAKIRHLVDEGFEKAKKEPLKQNESSLKTPEATTPQAGTTSDAKASDAKTEEAGKSTDEETPSAGKPDQSS